METTQEELLSEIAFAAVKIKNLIKQKEAQRQRLTELEQLSEEKHEAAQENKRIISLLEQEFQNIDLELEKKSQTLLQLEAHSKNLGQSHEVMAYENQRNSLQKQIAELEVSGLEKLEAKEEKLQEVLDHQTFSQGLKKTQAELGSEITTILNQYEKDHLNLKERIEGAFDELPKLIQDKLAPFLHDLGDSLSSLKGDLCLRCGMTLDKLQKELFTQQKEIPSCSYCQRILISQELLP